MFGRVLGDDMILVINSVCCWRFSLVDGNCSKIFFVAYNNVSWNWPIFVVLSLISSKLDVTARTVCDNYSKKQQTNRIFISQELIILFLLYNWFIYVEWWKYFYVELWKCGNVIFVGLLVYNCFDILFMMTNSIDQF